MSYSTPAPSSLATQLGGATAPVVGLRELVPWLLLVTLLTALVLFFVGADQGAVSIPSGSFVHELTHDGRHLLGFPCH